MGRALRQPSGAVPDERHVLRVAPSLRVVREAAGTGRHDQTPGTHASEERPGRSLVVGNPLPNRLGARGELPDAETEAGLVVGLLTSVGVEVDALMRGRRGQGCSAGQDPGRSVGALCVPR